MIGLDPSIRFGPWSTTLGLGALFGLVVAMLLLGARRNRSANRLLAALILVLVLLLMPYVIGFAGFYDAYPGLSFAPFGWALAIGPLLYLHVLRQTSSRLPPGWGWHLLPVAVKIVYTTVVGRGLIRDTLRVGFRHLAIVPQRACQGDARR